MLLGDAQERGFVSRNVANEEGGEILKGPRRLDLAKQWLAEAGYAEEPITFMAAQDIPLFKAWGDVTVDLLQHFGVKVDMRLSTGARSSRGCSRKRRKIGADGTCLSSPVMQSTSQA